MYTMRRIFYAPLTLIYVIRASRLMVKMRNHHEQRTDENYEKLSQLTYSLVKCRYPKELWVTAHYQQLSQALNFIERRY